MFILQYRQKTIGQLTFETLPQLVIQILLYNEIIFKEEGSGFVEDNEIEILLSAASAGFNGFLQIARIIKESQAVDEKFLQYALTCAMGRVGWLPFKNKIIKILSDGNNNNNKIQEISFNIKYNIPVISWCTSMF